MVNSTRSTGMSDFTADRLSPRGAAPGPQLDHKPHAAGAIAFIIVLAAGLLFAAFSIH